MEDRYDVEEGPAATGEVGVASVGCDEEGGQAVEAPEADGVAERVDAILNNCGAWGHGGRDLLRPLARQAAELEADLAGRTEHDAEYTRVLNAYEGVLKTLRQVAQGR